MKQTTVQTAENPQTKPKRRQLLLLFILLFVFVAITSCIVGYILGQRTESGRDGQMIDTILLDPGQSAGGKVPLSVSGQARYSDGTPYANGRVELHSEPRYTISDSRGYFFFHDVEQGDHKISITDKAGKSLATVDVVVAKENTAAAANLTKQENGGYQLAVSMDVALIELEVLVDEETGTIHIDTKKLTAVTNSGLVTTPEGTASSADGVILTPCGAAVLPDRSIVIPETGVSLTDGSFIWNDGTVTLAGGAEIAPDGTVTLADGTTAKPDADGVVALPDGTIVESDNTFILADGTKVISDNSKAVLTDGTVVDLTKGNTVLTDQTIIHSDNTITLKDGTKIDNANNTITTPDGKTVTGGVVTLLDGSEIKIPEGTSGYVLGGTTGQPIGVGTASGSPEPVQTETPIPTPQIPITPLPSTTPGASTTPPSPETTPDPAAIPGPAADPTPTPEPEPTPDPIPDPVPAPEPEPKTGGGGGSGKTNTNIVEVTENGRSWTQLTAVNLFADNNSSVPGKLYPGVSGVYGFNIKNTQTYDIRFTMTISEAAHEAGAIPFEYRLRTADQTYVAGTGTTWLTAAQLSSVRVTLPPNRNVQYTLEWRWPYESGQDDLDTRLGTSENTSHAIKVTIRAEQVE